MYTHKHVCAYLARLHEKTLMWNSIAIIHTSALLAMKHYILHCKNPNLDNLSKKTVARVAAIFYYHWVSVRTEGTIGQHLSVQQYTTSLLQSQCNPDHCIEIEINIFVTARQTGFGLKHNHKWRAHAVQADSERPTPGVFLCSRSGAIAVCLTLRTRWNFLSNVVMTFPYTWQKKGTENERRNRGRKQHIVTWVDFL